MIQEFKNGNHFLKLKKFFFFFFLEKQKYFLGYNYFLLHQTPKNTENIF